MIDKGFDFYVYGNIPNGAGLSSSASLELLTGVVAEHLFDLKLDRLDLVKIGKQTENNFYRSQLWHYGPICYWYGCRPTCYLP